jgi:glycosyltransferase involved in cell wall biosynthesis
MRGGTEMQTLVLLKALKIIGFDVTVCCYYEYDETIVQEFRNGGADVQLLKLIRSGGRSSINELWSLFLRLRTFFKDFRNDIVHIQYLAPAFVAIAAARSIGVRTIFCTIHTSGAAAYGIIAKLLVRIASRLCDVFICVSQSAERFWFRTANMITEDSHRDSLRHCTIYNGVDIEEIDNIVARTNREALKEHLSLNGKWVIGFVGRLVEAKGIGTLLDAMPYVLQHIPDAALCIVGDGPDREMFEQKAKRLNLEIHIRWVGALPRTSVFEHYTAMDCLATSSTFEGFGLTAVEAMAASLPVVGSSIEGLSEIIQDGTTGLLVPPSNPEALANALMQIHDHAPAALQMGVAGRQRVRELFSFERFLINIRSLYKR